MKKLKRKFRYFIATIILLLLFVAVKNDFIHISNNGLKTTTNNVFIEVELVRVVDGDTIVVNDNGEECKVRLIGVDTPESVHSDDSKNNEYGIIASDFTKEYLKEYDKIYLQYDIEPLDIYGRTLAYVWLSDDIDIDKQLDIENFMLNAILLKNGYAVNKEYKPNTYYAEIFEDIRQSAETNKIGLWNNIEYQKLVYQ